MVFNCKTVVDEFPEGNQQTPANLLLALISLFLSLIQCPNQSFLICIQNGRTSETENFTAYQNAYDSWYKIRSLGLQKF